jgi:hypothetical protein
MAIWLMETTTISSSILEAIERTLEMRRLGRQRFPMGGGGGGGGVGGGGGGCISFNVN